MRRRGIVAAVTVALFAVGAGAGAQSALAAKENVLVISRANNGSEGQTLAAVLRSLDYTVTLTGSLPSKLSSYSAVWGIMAYTGFTEEEQGALEGYVKGGGRLYLTAERPCCEELNLADQNIARAVLKNQSIVVGQQGDISGPLTFNPAAEDSITQSPNTLHEFPADAPGGMAGLGGVESPNVLASNGTTPVGAVFDEHDMVNHKGRLVIYGDIDWLAGYYAGGGGGIPVARRHNGGATRPHALIGGEETPDAATTRRRVVENIQDFLEKTPGRVSPSAAQYVGLGDSYASGLGSFSYLEGTTGKNGCYRAKEGYIEDIATELGLSLDFAACAGAKIGDLWEGKNAQLKEIGPETELVTLSIGGNDVGFASVLESCVSGAFSPGKKGCAARDQAAATEALEWLRYGRAPGSYEEPGGHAKSKNKVPLPSLQELYEAILAQAPKAEVIIVGYPILFESNVEEFHDCQVGTANGVIKLTINSNDVEWLDREAAALDELLEASVSAVRSSTGRDIRFADPRGPFNSHALCDSEGSWINALLFEGFGAPPGRKPESFHPTTTGQEALRLLIDEVGGF
jgi:hypothetical protein